MLKRCLVAAVLLLIPCLSGCRSSGGLLGAGYLPGLPFVDGAPGGQTEPEIAYEETATPE